MPPSRSPSQTVTTLQSVTSPPEASNERPSGWTEQQALDRTGRANDDAAQCDTSGSRTSRMTGLGAHRRVSALTEFTRCAVSQPEAEVKLPASRDAEHLRPRLCDEQHQGDFQRGGTVVRDLGNCGRTQAGGPPSDRVSVHLATEWSDGGTETIPTPPRRQSHLKNGKALTKNVVYPNFYHRRIGVDEQPLRELRTSLRVTADRYLNFIYSPAVTNKV